MYENNKQNLITAIYDFYLGPNGERYIYLYYLFFPYTSDLLAIYTTSDSQCTFEKQKHNC